MNVGPGAGGAVIDPSDPSYVEDDIDAEIRRGAYACADVFHLAFWHSYRDLTPDDLMLTAIEDSYWDLKALAKFGNSDNAKEVFRRFSALRDEVQKEMNVNSSIKGRWYFYPYARLEVRLGNPDTYEDFGTLEDAWLKQRYEELIGENDEKTKD